MAENTEISWADDTFNPWIGCMKVGPACDGCYAEALMDTRYGRVQWGAHGKGVGTRVRTAEGNWRKPIIWDREHKAVVEAYLRAGMTPPARFVFCASLADVFDNAVDPEWRRDLFKLIRATPNLTWLLLTKRPQNIVRLFEAVTLVCRGETLADRWPRNAAIGCTVVTQDEADRDVPHLLAAKAALKPAFAFLSMEPLLAPVDLMGLEVQGGRFDALHGAWRRIDGGARPDLAAHIDWVITGGETDQGEHKARPPNPDWFRDLAGQCAETGVPFHFKQWGEWTPGENVGAEVRGTLTGAYVSDDGTWHETRFTESESQELHCEDEPDVWRVGKKRAGRTLDGVTHDARPIPSSGS